MCALHAAHQDGLLQVALLEAGHQEGADDLALQRRAQGPVKLEGEA